jgi:probable phosphoglycerate mutase
METQDERAGEIHLFRHGETEWSRSGQHTGRTDIPLTANGRREASRLATLLRDEDFSLVLTSPLRRARETCELAGLAARAEVDPDLSEWDYGEYEGLRPDEIRRAAPRWMLFSDGCPGGESPEQVGIRVDRLLGRLRADGGRVALFGHGHLFRVLAARWIGLPPSQGCRFLLGTSTSSVLSWYHGIPAVRCWNASLAADEQDS